MSAVPWLLPGRVAAHPIRTPPWGPPATDFPPGMKLPRAVAGSETTSPRLGGGSVAHGRQQWTSLSCLHAPASRVRPLVLVGVAAGADERRRRPGALVVGLV